MRAPPPPTAHKGLIHPSYNSANSSALQVTTASGAYRRVVISYQRYEYNDNLSEGLSVINDTTNLSEGLPVINDTSAKMTCVVDDLCGCPFNQRLMTCGRWPVWPMTYGVAGLCGL